MAFNSKRLRLGIIISVCVILIAAVAGWLFIVPSIIEAKANDALAKASEKTGRHIEISGIQLSGFSAASVTRIMISDVGHLEKTAILFDDVKVGLSGLPFGNISVSSVDVDELAIHIRNDNGKTNFDDLIQSLKPKNKDDESGEKKSTSWKQYITPFPSIHISNVAVSMPEINAGKSIQVNAVSAENIDISSSEKDGRYEVTGTISALIGENDTRTTYETKVTASIKNKSEGKITLSMPVSNTGTVPAIFSHNDANIAFKDVAFVLPTTFEFHELSVQKGEQELIHADSAIARLMTLPPKKVSGVYFKEVELVKPVIHDFIHEDGSVLKAVGVDYAAFLMNVFRGGTKEVIKDMAADTAKVAAQAALKAGVQALINESETPGEDIAKAVVNEVIPKKFNVKDFFFSQRMFITDGTITVEDKVTGLANASAEHVDVEIGYRSIRKVLDYRIAFAALDPVTTEIELMGQYSLPNETTKGHLSILPLRTTDNFKKLQANLQNNTTQDSGTVYLKRIVPSLNLDKTILEASADYDVNLKKKTAKLDTKLSVSNLSWRLEALSKEPTDFSGSVGVSMNIDLGKHDFKLNGIDIHTNGAAFKLSADLSQKTRAKGKGKTPQTEDAWHFDIAADLPNQNMQALFDAVPHALRTELDGLTWTGSLGFHFEASGFLDTVSETQHKFLITPSADFGVLRWPDNRNLDVLNQGFKFKVNDPNALTEHEITIPPSIYPIYLGERALYNPKVTAEDIRSNYPDWVLFEDLNPWLIQLITTTEDGSFFTHEGFSSLQVKAALERNISRQTFSRGASTISMQLVKNLFFDRTKTLSRKFQEVIYTWLMESIMHIPKKRIMELYFNIIEFGPEIYGVEEAAKYYFGKRSNALSLKECAFLMAIIPNPRKGANYRKSEQIEGWLLKTMNFYIQEMYRRKCNQDTLAKTRAKLQSQGKDMVFEPCCPPRDSLQLMLDADTLSFHIPNPEDPTLYAYRTDLYTLEGKPLSPQINTTCGYHGDIEAVEKAEETESIFEPLMPAHDVIP